jgi:hypothetical protein
LLGGIFLYFLVTGAVFGYLAADWVTGHWDWLNDLHFFTKGSEILFDDGRRDLLYRPEERTASLGYDGAQWEVFPFPATTALLFWPLSQLSFETARLVLITISVGSALLVVLLAYLWSRDPVFALLVLLAHASFFTFHEVVRYSQLAPLMSLTIAAALLSFDRGHTLLGNCLLGVMAFKPSIPIAAFVFTAWWTGPRRVLVAAAIAVAIVVVIPLALVGIEGQRDYIHLLSRFREEAFHLHGILTAGSGWMLNWNGFVGRLLSTDLTPWPMIPFYIVTGALMLKVWLKRDLFEGWLAAFVATLLVIPHAVWYDWTILLGVAPFVAYTNRSLPLLGLLLALHLAVNVDTYLILNTQVTDSYPYLTTPIATAVLAYLAFSRHQEAEPMTSFPDQTRACGRAR